MNKKEKKPVKISNIILNAICIAIFVFAAYELIVKLTNNSIYLFGVRSDVVLSDSMSYKNEDKKVQKFLEGHDNQLQKGDLVYSKKVTKNTELNIYDIVIFKNKDSNQLTIHRIVDIKDGSNYLDGEQRYIIRADAANYASHDGAYKHDEIIALYQYKIPFVGHIHHFLTSIFGIILEVGIIIILLGYQFLDDKFFGQKAIENKPDVVDTQQPVIEEKEDNQDEQQK